MKYLKSKYILSALMSFMLTFECLAVADPTVLGADINPAPLAFPGNVNYFEFRFNNNGTATSSSFVTVEISFSNLDFENSTFNAATDIERVNGNTPFTWSYNAGVKVLTGTLNGNFAQLASNTIRIKNLKVLAANTDMSNPSTGGNVNVVTPTAVNSNVNNDNTNTRTYTTSAILPIELLSFDASKGSNCDAKLVWTSATESKFDYFQLEQSVDGKNFIHAGNAQKSKGSNSQYEQLAELKVAKGINVYYRLKMVDLDKTVKYSKTVGVQNDCAKKNKSTLLITPNPANNTIQVKEFNSNGVMYIYDMTGRLVLTAAISESENQNINVADLTSGTYLVQVTSNEGMFYSKLVKQ